MRENEATVSMKICELKKKYINWFKSAAGKVSACLLVASAVLIIIGLSDWGHLTMEEATNVNSILFGLATNLIGIVITVSFVQYFLDQQRTHDERREEAKKILRQDRIFQILVRSFSDYYRRLITPLDKIDGKAIDTEGTLAIEFPFSDLRDLYKSSLYLCDRVYRPAIESFYDSELALRKYCMESVRVIDFKYYPEIGNIMLDFIERSTAYDVRDFVLGNEKITSGKQPMTDFVSKAIADTSHDWIAHFQKEENRGNIIFPYVVLYETLKKEAEIINRYQAAIKEIIV